MTTKEFIARGKAFSTFLRNPQASNVLTTLEKQYLAWKQAQTELKRIKSIGERNREYETDGTEYDGAYHRLTEIHAQRKQLERAYDELRAAWATAILGKRFGYAMAG